MSTPRTDRQLVRIALLGTALMVVAILLALNFQRLPLVGQGAEYRAEFTDSAGLVAGEEVRISGLKVGTVTDIALGHGVPARVVVTFRVKGMELGRSSTAGIEVKTLLGQHFLSVTSAGGGNLPEGSVIPLARTTTPVNIVPAFAEIATRASAIDTRQMATAFDVLSETMESTAPEMGQTLRGLARISRSVTSRDEQIRELFARTSQVSGIVADRDQDIARLLTDTSTVLAELDRRRETISRIIDGTAALADQLRGLVKENATRLTPTLNSLNRVLGTLEANRDNIDKIIETGTVYAREFVSVGGTGPYFDATINFPRAFAVCAADGLPGPLNGILGPVLSGINQTVNGSSKPCLPLGPAAVTP